MGVDGGAGVGGTGVASTASLFPGTASDAVGGGGVGFSGLAPSMSMNFVDAADLIAAVTVSDAVITFTRASEGSYVSNTGAVSWFSPNVVQQSQTFDSAGWVKASANVSADVAVAPDGTMTADKLEPLVGVTSARIQQSGVPVKNGIPYNYSVHVKAGEFDWVRFRPSGSMGDVSVYFNASTGLMGTTLGGDNINQGVEDCGDGWYRIYMSGYGAADGSTVAQIYLAGSDGGATFPAATAGEGVWIWGCQLMRGITMQDYIPTVGAVAGYRARLGDNGLLREVGVTNMCPYSQYFDDASWSHQNNTIAHNTTVAPDLTTTADTLTMTGGNSQVYRSITYTAAQHVISCHFQKGGGNPTNWAQIQLGVLNHEGFFDLENGVVGTTDADSSGMEALENGWYRCWIVVTPTAGAANTLMGAAIGDNDFGAGTNTVNMWGTQIELGSKPTSYITTTGSAIARATDVVTVENIDVSSWWNPAAGTQVVTAVEDGAFVGYSRLVSYNDTAVNSNIELWLHPNASVHQSIVNSGAAQGNIASATNRSAGVFKVAHAWAENDVAFSVNGGAVATDTTVSLPLTLDTMTIGADQSGGNGFSGYIHAIDYFGSRRPDVPLQALAA